jgi:GntR family transcriptional repressor for pyruvate dehydrogenase complex
VQEEMRVFFVGIEVKKMSVIVSEHIESLINQNKYMPGDRLPSIKEWAENLSVSVGTIREAIQILKAKGLIDVRQGEGMFVRKIELKEIAPMMNLALVQLDELKELIDFRNIIEIGSVQLAAQHRTNEDLEEIKDALEQMNTDDKAIREEADFRFHCAIAKAAHNTLLYFLFQNISPAIKNLLHRYSFDLPEQNWQDHHSIFQAIMEQDTKKAAYYMSKHLSETRQRAFPNSEE